MKNKKCTSKQSWYIKLLIDMAAYRLRSTDRLTTNEADLLIQLLKKLLGVGNRRPPPSPPTLFDGDYRSAAHRH
jgi:hypothetical protein